MLTYPRTESRYLPANLAAGLIDHLQAIQGVSSLEEVVQTIIAQPDHIKSVLSTKKYVNDQKVTDHHAVIVTPTAPNWTALSEMERNIYELVAKRLLAIFLPPYVVDKTKIWTEVTPNDWFQTKGSVIVQMGYKTLYRQGASEQDDEERVLPSVTEGQNIPFIDYHVHQRETKPPDRYTEGDLLGAMMNPSGLIDDEALRTLLKEVGGLGTPATRAAIIEKLIQRQWVERKGKVLLPSESGIQVIAALDGQEITSPQLTAVWEKRLAEVEAGECPPYVFEQEMKTYVVEQTKRFLQLNLSGMIRSTGSAVSRTAIATCPSCQQAIYESEKYYYCERFSKEPGGCRFILAKTYLGCRLTKAELISLTQGDVSKEHTFTFPSGKSYTGCLVWIEKEGKMAIVNNPKVRKWTCPHCQGILQEERFSYRCGTCTLSIGKVILEASITPDHIEELLTQGHTRPISFVSKKTGKPFTAFLKREGDQCTIQFK